MFKKKINHLTFLIILIGFLFSCFTANKYLKKYDVIQNINGKYQNTYFFQKEGGTPPFWQEAFKIKSEIKKKNFLSSGDRYEVKYLPSRLIYFYYSIIDKDIKTQHNETDQAIFKTNNGKLGLVIIQIFFYFLCLVYLFFTLKKYSTNFSNIALLFIFFFLSFEPTLNQWNRVLYSESVFFCLQLLLLSMLISYNSTSSYKKVVLLGIILSLMYLQRTVSIYYCIIIFIYFYIFYKKKFFFNISIILIIYFFTHLFVGYSNLKRDGKFYLYPILAKEDLYGYFVPKILKYHNDAEFVKNFQTRHDVINNFVKKKKLKSENDIEISERIDLSNKNFLKSLELISAHPFSSLKEYFNSSIHYFILKPNELHFLIENNISYDGKFYLSKKFKSEFYIKLIYSMIIYSISFLGILYLIKNKQFKLLFLLLSSMLYFSLPVLWHKQSSYLAPVLLYLSIFFGLGVSSIFKKLNYYNYE